MVHARVLEAYINLALIYTTNNIFMLLPIKEPINKEGNRTTPFKLTAGTKTSVLNLRVLFCPCVLQKSTEYVGTKALNMHHRVKKGFRGIFVGIPQHQKRVSFVRTRYKEDNIFI